MVKPDDYLFQKKTGSRAQFSISKTLEKVLGQLPMTGVLFPKISQYSSNNRAILFSYRCQRVGVSGVTLHSYLYAWAERAKVAGVPERFAQAALGHNSQAIHRAYAKKAQIIVPSLEDYEKRRRLRCRRKCKRLKNKNEPRSLERGSLFRRLTDEDR